MGNWKTEEIYGKSMKIYGDVSEMCDFSSGYFKGDLLGISFMLPQNG